MKRVHLGRRIICVALIVMLLALTAAPALAASAKNPYGSYVVMTDKGSRLNLRSSPGGSVKAKLPRGTVVQYRGQKKGWWYVTYRDGSGYVDRVWLWSVANSTKAKYTPIYDNLYVRSQPKSGSTKLGRLKIGNKVTIVGQSGAWVKINYKGHTGWVSSKYLFRIS